MLYSVKIIYKLSVESFGDFFEESIVMLKAKSFDEAFIKAEKYAESVLIPKAENIYGQTIIGTVVSYGDCFAVYENDDDEATEVYSTIKKNRLSLSQKDYLAVLTDSCSKEEMLPLRMIP